MDDLQVQAILNGNPSSSQLRLDGLPISGGGLTVDTLAKVFSCTTRNVQELAEKGVIKRLGTGLYAPSSITDYIVWMRGKMTGKANPLAEDYKTRDLKATAEMKELKVARQRQELHHERYLNLFFSTAIKTAVSRLRALPFTKAPIWFRCKSEAELCEKAMKAIDEALEELGNMDLKKEMEVDDVDDNDSKDAEAHDEFSSEDDEAVFTACDDEFESMDSRKD